MKRMMTAICCTCVLGLATLVGAQSMDKMDKDKMGKETKVTGCVAEGTEAGHFMLNNAMMAGKMDKMHKDAMAKDDMKPMSVALMGGDLKAHVGHKVEVTGMMADTKGDAMAKDKMDMHTLNVKSVKMIAATCP